MLALRSSSTAAATVAAAGPTNQLAEPRHRNFHPVAAPGVARAIRGRRPARTIHPDAMHALRSSSAAAANVAAAASTASRI